MVKHHSIDTRRLDLEDLWRQLSDPDNTDTSVDKVLLRKGNTRRVYLLRSSNTDPLVAKCWYRSHGPFRLKDKASLHSGENEAHITALAHERGVAPYAPVAFEQRGWGRRRQSLLLLPYLQDRVDLQTLVEDPAIDDALKEQLIHGFGAALGRLHNCGLTHNDYKLDNVLVDPTASAPGRHLEIIDWGKGFEIRSASSQATYKELLYALSCLVRRAVNLPDLTDLFLGGYATESPWFASNRQSLQARLSEDLEQKQRRSNRRVWRNALREARLLSIGKVDDLRYYVFQGVDPQAAIAAVRGADSPYTVRTWNAAKLWQAANVLRSLSEDYGDIVGLVRRTSLLGSGQDWLVCDPSDRPFLPEELLARAQSYL